MFEPYAPYRALASYAPEGVEDETKEARRAVVPWFRGDWALGGRPLVEAAALILHNKKFLEAAKAAFGTSCVNPEFVAVNINGPMPACTTHLDNPSPTAQRPKTKLGLPDLDHSKSPVLDSLPSPESMRGDRHGQTLG
jgi:hypothetical protein